MCLSQLEALILLSGECEQYVKYDCKAAPLNQNNESNAWWVDRNDELHFYWSGDGEREEEMEYEGHCYCHNRDNCLNQDRDILSKEDNQMFISFSSYDRNKIVNFIQN